MTMQMGAVGQVALYFAWLGFYTKMLIVPALVGLIAFVIGIIRAFESPFHPRLLG